MDDLYVVARRVLLDALEALGAHREAVIVVGAQAVYLRVGEGDVAVAPYTTDGDLALDPALLGKVPPLEAALAAADVVPGGRDAVGVWFTRRQTPSRQDVQVQVDLLVPEAVSPGKGRRAARLSGHQAAAARIVRGLEGALVDNDVLGIEALDPEDGRVLPAKVAGPAALLVAKVHKIEDRRGSARASDKDALDVFRILRGVPTEDLAERLGRLLVDARSEEAGRHGIALLGDLFGPGGEGADMAARALSTVMDPTEVRLSCQYLVEDLLAGGTLGS